MSNYIPCIVAEDSVSLMIGGDMKVITDSHINYSDIRQAIADQDWDLAERLVDVGRGITEFGGGEVEVRSGQVYYKGQALHNTLTIRIINMKNEGFNVDPMLRFLENLMDNPSHRAVNELYDFLEAGSLPITEDGHFLAYKMVREDFTDTRTGTFDNSPGATPEMPRNQVDEDKDRTCSDGLHFCSRGYLGHYGGHRVVILKINPQDVVAIPADYNNTKGRACRYEVLREAEIAVNDTESRDEFTSTVVDTGTDTVVDLGDDIEYREEANGSVTALFTFDEAAERICGSAVNPKGALRKRISRGSVVSEWHAGHELYRAPLTPSEEENYWASKDDWDEPDGDWDWGGNDDGC